jgi:hypothetical protein
MKGHGFSRAKPNHKNRCVILSEAPQQMCPAGSAPPGAQSKDPPKPGPHRVRCWRDGVGRGTGAKRRQQPDAGREGFALYSRMNPSRKEAKAHPRPAQQDNGKRAGLQSRVTAPQNRAFRDLLENVRNAIEPNPSAAERQSSAPQSTAPWRSL